MSAVEQGGIPTAPLTTEMSMATDASAQYLASLVFLSYRFSQGGIGTQNRLLSYIEDRFHGEFMTDERAPEVHRRAERMIGPYFLNQVLHPATAIPWDDDSPEAAKKTNITVANELLGLFDRFKNEAYMHDFPYDEAAVATSIIIMDEDYLARDGGRAGDSVPLKIVVSPYKRDPYDSLFIKYGVLGTNTKTPEFNALFAAVSSENVIRQLDTNAVSSLRRMVRIYVEQHPDTAQDERIVGLQNLCKELQDAR